MTIAINSGRKNYVGGYNPSSVQNILHEEYKGTGNPITTTPSELYAKKNIVSGNTGLQSVSQKGILATENQQNNTAIADYLIATSYTNYNEIGSLLMSVIPKWLYEKIDYQIIAIQQHYTTPDTLPYKILGNAYLPVAIIFSIILITIFIFIMLIGMVI